MIYSFQQITAIRNYLQIKQEESPGTFKYKLVKHLNHATSIYIYDESGEFRIDLSDITVGIPIGAEIPIKRIAVNDEHFFPSVDVRYISQEDYKEDIKHYDTFFADKATFEGVTRRLSNAFGKYRPVKKPELPPIVSFYSYKGGVGRTTTLAALASYHARRTGAKVLILDCDFEAPGLVNFFGMNEDDLASKGGIVEYLTDVAYLKDKKQVDISQYIHTISTSASKDPLGYAGEKGGIYVMNAGNVSIYNISPTDAAPADLRSHQDHYMHGLARLDFSNADHIVEQFQEMLLQAYQLYHPDVILIDSRTGFNDIFNNIALRISDIVVGFFGTSRQNIPGLYNFLDTIWAENQGAETAPEIVLANAIASNVRQSFKNFKKQIEQYNLDTEHELNPETFSIEYIPRMAEIGTPTDDGDILLDYTDPNRYAFPDYQNGKGERLLELLSVRIEKKNFRSRDAVENNQPASGIDLQPNENLVSVDANNILNPLRDFFTKENISYAETLDQNRKDFLENYYYFRNYLRDIFLRDTFIIRGYKGTGKTLLYHALEDTDFIAKLKEFSGVSTNFQFVNVVDKNNILQLKGLGFDSSNTNDKSEDYYRRFWVIYTWNALLKKYSDIYQSNLPSFDVLSDGTTKNKFETFMKPEKILEVEHELRKLNEALVQRGIIVVISFDYLDQVVKPSEWNTNGQPIVQLINFCQAKVYTNFYPKIFIRTDLFHKVQNLTNANALENRVLSLDWTTEELFAYFFKIVFKTSGYTFIYWLEKQHPDEISMIEQIKQIIKTNHAQIPLEQKEILEFLVNNFFGQYVDEHKPNFGKSYEWFHLNLKNANDVISLRPFIALISYCLKDAQHKKLEEGRLLSGKYFNKPAARETAAQIHLTDIWKEHDLLKTFLETLHKSNNPKLDGFRQHSISEEDLRLLILNIFDLNSRPKPDWEKVQELIKLLQDSGIIRQNTSYKVSYSFAFLYKYYLRLQGSPQRRVKK